MREITIDLLKGMITIRTRVTTLNVVTSSVLESLPYGGTYRMHLSFAVPEYTWQVETRKATMQELEVEYARVRDEHNATREENQRG